MTTRTQSAPQWDVERREHRMLVSRSWTCGHCGSATSAELGVGLAPYEVLRHVRLQRLMSEPELKKERGTVVGGLTPGMLGDWLDGDRFRFGVYFCSGCQLPTTFFPDGSQFPDAVTVGPIRGLPAEVEHLFEEVRRCMSVSAYTSAMMACRKLLMNVAATQGAKEGLGFVEYVDFLVSNGYSPPNGRVWVDKIRLIGNQAAHKIPTVTRADAILVISFTDALLRFVFGFPFLATNAQQ